MRLLNYMSKKKKKHNKKEKKEEKRIEEQKEVPAAIDDNELEKLAGKIKTFVMSEYQGLIGAIEKPSRLFWINFFIGLFRGIGFFLGMTIVGAIILTALTLIIKPMLEGLAALDIPLISSWLADLIASVQDNLGK
jgi:hypothetical protein